MKPKQVILKTSPGRALILLLSVIFILLFYYWYKNINWIEKEIDQGWTIKAYKQRYLAAEYFLRKAGIDSQTERGFKLIEELDSGSSVIKYNDTIVLVNGFGALTDSQTNKLINWVSNGGVLVASSENVYHSWRYKDDKLFAHYGISVDIENKFKNDDEAEEREKESKNSKPDSIKAESSLSLPKNHTSIYDEEDSTIIPGWGPPFIFNTEIDKFGWRNSERGTELVYFSVDNSGYFAATTGNSMWNNDNINSHNNAHLLWLFAKTSDKVWFLLNERTQSLLSRIWAFSPLAVIFFLCSIVFWYFRSSRRIGPIIPIDHRVNRRFLEHIQSSGELLWRANQGAFLIERLRRDTLQIVNRKHPLIKNIDNKVKQKKLAEILKLPATTIQYAYSTEQIATERQFLEHIQQLQKIRDAL